MSETNLTNTTPQFRKAEYAGTPGANGCKFCRQSLGGRYYRINGAMACSSCGERAKRELPQDSHAAYARGLLFGAGAAIAGLILYAAFGIITGLMIGYVSLAVGYMVGKAIHMGSKGVSGRRYQIAAVLLTYAAVSLAAIPIAVSQAPKKAHPQAQIEQPSAADRQPVPVQQPKQQPTKPRMSLGPALARLALVGLASPFLELQDPFHGLIGLVILFVGIRIAWQITGKPQVQIHGPFANSAPAPA